MTRNNLGEHLSWLLTEKRSIPPADNVLPPVTLSFTQAEPSAAAQFLPEPAEASGEEVPERTNGATATVTAQSRPQEMARLRGETGSASRPNLVTMGPRMQETPSHNAVARSAGSHANIPTAPKPTPFSTARQVPYSPQRDVEIMDLTESLDQVKSPRARQLAGRKRKSSEMAHELPGDAVPRPGPIQPTDAVPPPPRGSQQGFTAIDEIFEAPSEPPPPYSTIAPGLAPPSRPPAPQTFATRPGSAFGPPDSPVMADSEEDEEDLVDFSRSRDRMPACKKRAVEKQKAVFPERVAESPSKPPSLACGESFTLQEKDVEKALRTTFSPERRDPPPRQDRPRGEFGTGTPGETENEDEADVERFFALPRSAIDMCIQRLTEDYERRLDEITDSYENGEESSELQKHLDDAEERLASMQKLADHRSQYEALAEEKEQLRAALKAAIRARSGIDEAKAATAACRAKTQLLLGECVRHMFACKDEVTAVLRRDTDAKESSKKVAVQSTQAPPHAGVPKPCAPSSSRIAQTQMAAREPRNRSGPEINVAAARPVQDSPPNIDSYFSPSRHRPKAMEAASSHEAMDVDDEDDYGSLDDDDVLDATNPGFSNRMAMPPSPIHDEYDFDDEITAEDLENHGVRTQPSHIASTRAPLAQTSGNSQSVGAQKSAKKKKRTPKPDDDNNLEHMFRFPWSHDVKETLRARFKLRGFRQSQLEAINETLAGRDVFVLMPTGGGKSLCYQLPSLIASGKTNGVTVVISPLLSLMEDQVGHLRKLLIQAFVVNSETDKKTRDGIMNGLWEKDEPGEFVQLLYVTPEMLSKSDRMIKTFDMLYRRRKLARLVIDEAHCVSQWGHDFRPDYKLIGDVRRRFPSIPVMALTATATENVRLDTVHNLGITGCKILTSSFNRPNLYYEVRLKPKGKEDVKQIAELIREKYHRKCGIVYCFSRKNCETMAASLLKDHKIKAHHYHAGLDADVKKKIQKDWQVGVHHVIVATIAFGMGIDKPDVRFVIHHTIPKSLEGYYQETGRAGRDQLESGCYLFYGYQDVSKLRRIIDEGEGDWEQKERQHQMLRKMAQYCDNRSDCRRVQVLRYFNEDFDAEDCEGQCDNCCSGSNFQTVDFTNYAQQAVSLVGKLASHKATLLHCMDVFRGAATKKITESGLTELDEYGAGSDLDRGDVERLFYHLLTERAIIEENVVNKSGFANQYAVLGKFSSEFRNGRRKLQMQVRSTPRPKAKMPAKKKAKKDPYDEQSKNWKKTAGSRAHTEMPMSTNISSPIQAATGRKRLGQRSTVPMHGNGYRRDNFVVSDEEDGDYAESDGDSFDDGFAPLRIGNEQRHERARAPGRPITADDMLQDLDDVARDVIEQFVQEGKDLVKKLMVDKNLRRVPFTDTMLRHMAIMRTTTPEEMMSIPEVNPDNVRLHGKKFCKLVQGFLNRCDEVMQTSARPDPNDRNVIDLVSDEEAESEDEYGEFLSEDDEGEASGYFQPPPEVAEFNARINQTQETPSYNEAPPARAKKGGKASKKRSWKATGSTAAPRRKGAFGGNKFGSYAYDGTSAGGASKKKGPSKRKSGDGGRAASGPSHGGRSTTTGGNRSIVSMMPT